MNENVVDFESKKQNHLHKRKEAKVDAIKRAFRLARGEPDPKQPGSGRKKTPEIQIIKSLMLQCQDGFYVIAASHYKLLITLPI